MTGTADLLLERALDGGALQALLFFTFSLHFVFALLTVGTAILAAAAAVAERLGIPGAPAPREVLRSFFVHKSVAITLGVAPLLLMQMGHTVPFLGAATLFAPAWMSLVLLLLAGLGLLEWVKERPPGSRWNLALATAGAVAVVAVPAVFAAVLATAERPAEWDGVLARGGEMGPSLAAHWALRWLHVLGAAVLAAAVFRYARADDAVERRRLARRWIAGAVAYQVAVGISLLATLERVGALVATLVVTGAVAALLVAWRSRAEALPRPAALGALALVAIFAMLLARQVVQDRAIAPFEAALAARGHDVREALARHEDAAAARYEGTLDVPRTVALTRYSLSCRACHGAVANGAGDAAPRLAVPPEDLSRLRAAPEEVLRIAREGVPGTAMPRFGFYTGDELRSLVAFLGEAGWRPAPEPLAREPPPEARAEAAAIWAARCSVCHGPDGAGSALARRFEPPPPDLRRVTWSPARTFAVVSEGYPGTLMPAFGHLPEETRWALVERVHALFEPR